MKEEAPAETADGETAAASITPGPDRDPVVDWDGQVHPAAVVHSDAELHPTARVGPHAVVGPGVTLGAEVEVASNALVERDTVVGEGCRIHHGAVLGTDPQDLKYEGEPATLEVGSGTVIREYATLNRGTRASGKTVVGENCLIMAYAHVAHDCRIGDRVILANTVNMGGHVEIDDHAVVGGVSAIHQFVRIGRHAFVGGGSRLPQDVPPYLMVAGNPCSAYGLNTVGLRRRGFDREVVGELRSAYRKLFQSDQNLGRALDSLEEEGGYGQEVAALIQFIRASERGVVT